MRCCGSRWRIRSSPSVARRESDLSGELHALGCAKSMSLRVLGRPGTRLLVQPQAEQGDQPCSAISRYQKRLSGPLLDRIDIHVEVPRVPFQKLSDERRGEPSAAIRARVEAGAGVTDRAVRRRGGFARGDHVGPRRHETRPRRRPDHQRRHGADAGARSLPGGRDRSPAPRRGHAAAFGRVMNLSAGVPPGAEAGADDRVSRGERAHSAGADRTIRRSHDPVSAATDGVRCVPARTQSFASHPT